MKRWITAAALAVACIANNNVNAQSYKERVENYIATYKDLAVMEQKRSGIPAAITLAQGIHETEAGNSELATQANNHFGIKCKKSWTGETFAHTDDAPNECFRKYSSAIESYKDHSDYLSTSQRYAALFKLSPTDYAAWAIGLRQCGYATNPRYSQMLIRIVEDYRLQEHTYAALENTPAYAAKAEIVPENDARVVTPATQPVVIPVQDMAPAQSETRTSSNSSIIAGDLPAENQKITYPPYGAIVKVNGLKAVYARKGDMPLEYALKTDVRYERLLDMNEISDRPLPADMYLYLEKKHTRGLRTTHIVKEGESIHNVAQYEGMQAKSLRALNLLSPSEEPAAGVVLQLQQETPVKPQVIAAKDPVVVGPAPAVIAKEEAVEQPIAASVPVQQAVYIEKTDIPESASEDAPAVAESPATMPSSAAMENTVAAVNPPVNIANEKPVEEEIKQAKQAPAKEVDPLDALKAKFDKVVYAPKTETAPAVEEKTPEPVAKHEAVKEKETASAGDGKFYTVKKGDTAFSIAKRNNTTVRQLREWNKLDFEDIKIGQKLRIK